MKKQPKSEDVSRYADMLPAMGTEPRLRIMRLLIRPGWSSDSSEPNSA